MLRAVEDPVCRDDTTNRQMPNSERETVEPLSSAPNSQLPFSANITEFPDTTIKQTKHGENETNVQVDCEKGGLDKAFPGAAVC